MYGGRGDFMRQGRRASIRIWAVLFAVFSLQSAFAVKLSDWMNVSIETKSDPVLVGDKVFLTLMFHNESGQPYCLTTDLHYRFQIERDGIPPPETEMQRQSHGDFRPGDGPALDEGPVVCDNVGAHDYALRRMDLTRYFDLNKPGVYKVALEVEWPGSSGWLKTNSTTFEVKARDR